MVVTLQSNIPGKWFKNQFVEDIYNYKLVFKPLAGDKRVVNYDHLVWERFTPLFVTSVTKAQDLPPLVTNIVSWPFEISEL